MKRNGIFFKRLMVEQRALDKAENVIAWPIDDTKLEWHFTLKGPQDSPMESGFYHGVITLTDRYPFEAPNTYFLTVR